MMEGLTSPGWARCEWAPSPFRVVRAATGQNRRSTGPNGPVHVDKSDRAGTRGTAQLVTLRSPVGNKLRVLDESRLSVVTFVRRSLDHARQATSARFRSFEKMNRVF